MPHARALVGLELVGNALCLDFVNTVNSRRRTVHDYLGSYADLLDWSEYAGALQPGATVRLRARPADHKASAMLGDAHRLRAAIFAVFSAIASGGQPGSDHVADISDWFATAMRRSRIERRTSGDDRYAFELGWAPDDAQVDAPLWPVARSAGELLLSDRLDRVGECPGCGWLFLDVSRNGTRRWCSMATCGSRDKMSRYHQRQRRHGRP